jgi:hypothetical protein
MKLTVAELRAAQEWADALLLDFAYVELKRTEAGEVAVRYAGSEQLPYSTGTWFVLAVPVPA